METRYESGGMTVVKSWLYICSALLLATGCSQNYEQKQGDEALSENGLRPVSQQKKPAASSEKQGELPQGHPALGQSGKTALVGAQSDLGGVKVTVPPGWVGEAPASSMRLAQYRLGGDKAGSDDAILAVFHFGTGQGGSIDANIERWYGQFTQPDGSDTKKLARRWSEKVGQIEVELVEMSGTFSAGMGVGAQDGPLPDQAMLGAIAQAPAGLYFFKLTGPAPTVAFWKESFLTYINSLLPG
jgi:hypothetical protein